MLRYDRYLGGADSFRQVSVEICKKRRDGRVDRKKHFEGDKHIRFLIPGFDLIHIAQMCARSDGNLPLRKRGLGAFRLKKAAEYA